MGICSVEFNEDIIGICPKRFLERRRVLEDIADAYFGTRHDLLVFAEVGLRSIGNFDFVMVKHYPMSNEIEDFVVVETQAADTTSTGKLVQALSHVMAEGEVSAQNYEFGLNIANVWKRSFTQVLNKGIVLET